MKRKKRSAKALVMDPVFRPRQEKSKKGKGSYARRPRNQSQDSGPFSWAFIASSPFGLSLSKPCFYSRQPFDKLRANG